MFCCLIYNGHTLIVHLGIQCGMLSLDGLDTVDTWLSATTETRQMLVDNQMRQWIQSCRTMEIHSDDFDGRQ